MKKLLAAISVMAAAVLLMCAPASQATAAPSVKIKVQGLPPPTEPLLLDRFQAQSEGAGNRDGDVLPSARLIHSPVEALPSYLAASVAIQRVALAPLPLNDLRTIPGLFVHIQTLPVPGCLENGISL